MKIKRTLFDILGDRISLGLLAAVCAYLALRWNGIPDQIPSHYDALGNVDAWGSKGGLWILPAAAGALYLVLTVVERFPAIWNTGIRITEQNRERVYRILKDVLVTVKLWLVVTFCFLTLNTALARPLPAWFLPAFLLSFFVPFAAMMVRLVRAR